MRVVFVLPRYGSNLGGGAEALARALLLAWASGKFELPRAEIEVWTTCAVDHRTWSNQLPAGKTVEDEIEVTRFKVSERNTDTFLSCEFAMRDGWPLSVAEQLDWLENSVNSHDLYAEIEKRKNNVDLFVFAPYLFGTSFWGPLIAPEKSILLPCLHNEHYAYQKVFKTVFSEVRGLIFNARAEMELAGEIFGELPNNSVVGMGFDEAKQPNLGLLENFGLEPQGYFIYAGRKEEGKNVGLLQDWYNVDFPIVFVGAGELPKENANDWVNDLGFVSEDEKQALIAGARALIQLSENESFSIVLMEAWLHSTPVVVHGKCAVTKAHTQDSNGGLYPTNQGEFNSVLRELIENSELASSLGCNGKAYVRDVYSWNAVTGRLGKFLSNVI